MGMTALALGTLLQEHTEPVVVACAWSARGIWIFSNGDTPVDFTGAMVGTATPALLWESIKCMR